MKIYFKYIRRERRRLEKMNQSMNLESRKKNRPNPEKQGGKKITKTGMKINTERTNPQKIMKNKTIKSIKEINKQNLAIRFGREREGEEKEKKRRKERKRGIEGKEEREDRRTEGEDTNKRQKKKYRHKRILK